MRKFKQECKIDKAIKNKVFIDNNLDNHPANGIITTSAIKYADITYET